MVLASAGKQQRWDQRQAERTPRSLSSALTIGHALKQHHHSFGTAYRKDLSYAGNECAAILCAA